MFQEFTIMDEQGIISTGALYFQIQHGEIDTGAFWGTNDNDPIHVDWIIFGVIRSWNGLELFSGCQGDCRTSSSSYWNDSCVLVIELILQC